MRNLKGTKKNLSNLHLVSHPSSLTKHTEVESAWFFYEIFSVFSSCIPPVPYNACCINWCRFRRPPVGFLGFTWLQPFLPSSSPRGTQKFIWDTLYEWSLFTRKGFRLCGIEEAHYIRPVWRIRKGTPQFHALLGPAWFMTQSDRWLPTALVDISTITDQPGNSHQVAL